MTTLDRHHRTCAVCGATSEQWLMGSTSMFEPPDFDTRPGQLMRDTLDYWVMCCPHCGYCAPDLAESVPEASRVVLSPEYKEILDDASLPEKARHFLCCARILHQTGMFADAGWSALHASWACDDELNEEGALRCRRAAIDYWQLGKRSGQPFSENLWGEFAIITDVYRRTGQFELARESCEEGLREPDLPDQVESMLRRQLVLIQRRDPARHSMKELPEGPEGARRVVLH